MEDIYLPYRPKRRTRATIAREKGLEPLADILFAQGQIDPESEARGFIDPEKGVESAEDALAGARDIIAEKINEDSKVRATTRKLFFDKGRHARRLWQEKRTRDPSSGTISTVVRISLQRRATDCSPC